MMIVNNLEYVAMLKIFGGDSDRTTAFFYLGQKGWPTYFYLFFSSSAHSFSFFFFSSFIQKRTEHNKITVTITQHV
jgi:hypothetical protein